MRKKIPLILLLNSLGITKKKIFYNLETTKKISHILFFNDKILKTSNALIKINEAITEKKVSIVRKIFYNYYFNLKKVKDKYKT
jgi:hypothetical protein